MTSSFSESNYSVDLSESTEANSNNFVSSVQEEKVIRDSGFRFSVAQGPLSSRTVTTRPAASIVRLSQEEEDEYLRSFATTKVGKSTIVGQDQPFTAIRVSSGEANGLTGESELRLAEEQAALKMLVISLVLPFISLMVWGQLRSSSNDRVWLCGFLSVFISAIESIIAVLALIIYIAS